ncbi:unnamed protein product, partial [Ectocarpus sp. 12 AP-2014]
RVLVKAGGALDVDGQMSLTASGMRFVRALPAAGGPAESIHPSAPRERRQQQPPHLPRIRTSPTPGDEHSTAGNADTGDSSNGTPKTTGTATATESAHPTPALAVEAADASQRRPTSHPWQQQQQQQQQESRPSTEQRSHINGAENDANSHADPDSGINPDDGTNTKSSSEQRQQQKKTTHEVHP